MTIYVIGLNYTSAPLALREQFVYLAHEIIDTLLILKQALNAEVALLSTCNRTELYIAKHNISILPEDFCRQALNLLAINKAVNPSVLLKHTYILYADQAITHIYRVASGLDSMVLGETQILGQIKSAMRQAQTAGTLGACLHYVFQHSFSTAKAVRTQTAIGASSVSLAAAAVKLAQKIFGDLSKRTILMVGAGEMIELCMAHFLGHQPKQLTIVNRSVDKANALIQQRRQQTHMTHLNTASLEQLGELLGQYDIVVSCTASATPIINLDMMRTALADKTHRRVSKTTMMVDLAVPRDISIQIEQLADVYLYTVDDLGRVVQEGRDSRSAAVVRAEAIVLEHVESFLNWQAVRRVAPTIQTMQARANQIREAVVNQAILDLNNGLSTEVLIEQLSRQLTQKILHHSVSVVRQLAADTQVSDVSVARLNEAVGSIT